MGERDDSGFILTTPERLRALVREAVDEALNARAGGSPSDVLTCEEAGKLLQLHPRVVVRHVKEHGLPGHKVGREWRFDRGELTAWVRKQKGEAA